MTIQKQIQIKFKFRSVNSKIILKQVPVTYFAKKKKNSPWNFENPSVQNLIQKVIERTFINELR